MMRKLLTTASLAAICALGALSALAAIPGYTQLDYLETQGGAYFDSGLKASGKFNVDAKIQALSAGYMAAQTGEWPCTVHMLFGGGDMRLTNVIAVAATGFRGTNVTATCYYHGTDTLDGSHYRNNHGSIAATVTSSGGIQTPIVYTFTRSSNDIKLKWGSNTLGTFYRSNFVSTNEFLIGYADIPDLAMSPANMKIWYFKIVDATDGNALLRDFVPVRDNATGAVGLYDRVTETFFGNVAQRGRVFPGPVVHAEWLSNDDGLFDYGCEWTVGGYTKSSTLADVPVLLRLSPSTVAGFEYAQCLADGSDIAFSSESDFSNRLPCEIDTWNTSGTSLIWVKVPSLSGTSTKIYMRWGRTTPAANLPTSEVWSDYVAVWHMNSIDEEKGTTNSTIRSMNATNVVANGSTTDTGKIGLAVKSNPDNRLLAPPYEVYADASNDLMPHYFTMSCWSKESGTFANAPFFGNITYPTGTTRFGWQYQIETSKAIDLLYGKGLYSSAYVYYSYGSGTVWDKWQYNAFTSDGYSMVLYHNGAQVNSKTFGNRLGGSGAKVFIGGVKADLYQYFDEMRISRSVLSSDRIWADYQMVNSSSFATAASAMRLRGDSLSIVGDPEEYASDVVSYGTDETVVDGSTVECAAPEYVFLGGTTDHRAFCLGWDLYEVVNGADVFVRASTNTTVVGENTTNALVTITGAMKLVWNWEEQYLITTGVAAGGGGSVTGGGWSKAGAGFLLTAVPDEGYKFICWAKSVNTSIAICSQSVSYGSLSSNHVNPFIAVFVPEEYVEPDWLYLPDYAKMVQMASPHWAFETTQSGSNLFIPVSSGHIAPASAAVLDLTGSIRDVSGASYSLTRFTATGYDRSIFSETSSSTKSSKVSGMILPESFTYGGEGTLSFLGSCVYFDFLGDMSMVNSRAFYYALSCQRIRFHYFPPNVPNYSSYTFVYCGGMASDYRFKIEYPDFLEDAWLCATNVGARFDYKTVMTAKEKQTALSYYRGVFGSGAAEPPGYASLNFINGEASPKRCCALVPYTPAVKPGKIALGMMGLPYALAKAEAMSPSYGYHEYATGDDIVVTAPRQFTTFTNVPHICKGYVLSDNPSVTNHYASSFTVSGESARNLGITWIWKPFSGYKGMIISVK